MKMKFQYLILAVLFGGVCFSSCKKDKEPLYNYHIRGVITEENTDKPVANQEIEIFGPAEYSWNGYVPETVYNYASTDDSGYFDIPIVSDGPLGSWLRVSRDCGEDFQLFYGSSPNLNSYFADTFFHFEVHAISTIEVQLADTGAVTTVDSIFIFKDCFNGNIPLLTSADASFLIYDITTGGKTFQDYGGTQGFLVDIYTPGMLYSTGATVEVPEGGTGTLKIEY